MAKTGKAQRFAERVLLAIAIYLVLFSVAHTVLTAVTGIEQTTLIEQTFMVVGIEAGGLLLKRILEKVFKVKKEDDDV
jgi:purine-cytosine permease-like protein